MLILIGFDFGADAVENFLHIPGGGSEEIFVVISHEILESRTIFNPPAVIIFQFGNVVVPTSPPDRLMKEF